MQIVRSLPRFHRKDVTKYKLMIENIIRQVIRHVKGCSIAVNIAALFDQLNPFIGRNLDAPQTTNRYKMRIIGFFERSVSRYWSSQTLEEVISEADQLFEDEKYLQVYELLNRQKYSGQVEVQWRIARVLYKMSKEQAVSRLVKNEMVREGLDILKASLALGRGTFSFFH